MAAHWLTRCDLLLATKQPGLSRDWLQHGQPSCVCACVCGRGGGRCLTWEPCGQHAYLLCDAEAARHAGGVYQHIRHLRQHTHIAGAGPSGFILSRAVSGGCARLVTCRKVSAQAGLPHASTGRNGGRIVQEPAADKEGSLQTKSSRLVLRLPAALTTTLAAMRAGGVTHFAAYWTSKGKARGCYEWPQHVLQDAAALMDSLRRLLLQLRVLALHGLLPGMVGLPSFG